MRKYHAHFDNFLPMAQLRLGAIGLSPKDVAYIRALVRLYANTDKLGWSFADQPPYEAVVVKRAGRDADPAWFETFDGMVLTLVGPPGAPERDEVAYPVHAEQFRTWLKLRQHGMPVPLASEPPAPVQAAAQPAAAARPPAAEPVSSTVSARPARQGQRRFKLRRWPAPALLAGNDFHLKIATLMVRNAIGTEMLAVLTGHPESDCRRFVDALHKQGLLVEHAALSTLVEPAAAAAPAPAPARAGLLASLRRHLGV